MERDREVVLMYGASKNSPLVIAGDLSPSKKKCEQCLDTTLFGSLGGVINWTLSSILVDFAVAGISSLHFFLETDLVLITENQTQPVYHHNTTQEHSSTN